MLDILQVSNDGIMSSAMLLMPQYFHLVIQCEMIQLCRSYVRLSDSYTRITSERQRPFHRNFQFLSILFKRRALTVVVASAVSRSANAAIDKLHCHRNFGRMMRVLYSYYAFCKT